jgi:hypothetical protein
MALLPPSSLLVLHGAAAFWLFPHLRCYIGSCWLLLYLLGFGIIWFLPFSILRP